MAESRSVEILLVEDNPTDAELTMRALRKNDIANMVMWVRDGAEALDFMFREGAYAGRDAGGTLKLVLLDIKTPKVSGIEVLRRLKGDDRTRATPVVIMSSSGEDRDVAESYKLGVNSYIVKPVKFETFLEAVSRIGHYWTLMNRVPH